MFLWYTGSLPVTNPKPNLPGAYVRLSGTSFAAPLVSGAAALLLAKEPTLTPDAIKARLMKTARKGVFPFTTTFSYTNPARTQVVRNDLFTVGAGYLDIQRAINNTDTAPAGLYALSPKASQATTGCPSGQTNCIKVSHDSSSLFSTSTTATWGSSVLWGDGTLYPLTILKDGDQ
jgi:serine protease AprX